MLNPTAWRARTRVRSLFRCVFNSTPSNVPSRPQKSQSHSRNAYYKQLNLKETKKIRFLTTIRALNVEKVNREGPKSEEMVNAHLVDSTPHFTLPFRLNTLLVTAF